MADIFNMADAWNAGGTTFTAIKMDVTDTASAAGSLLMDLLVGGVSRVRAPKAGGIVVNSSGVEVASTSNAAAATRFAILSDRLYMTSAGQVTWSSSTSAVTPIDLSILREAANTLAQRNGANAQSWRIYNTYTDGSNYERGIGRWLSNVYDIGTEQAGTGTARTMSFVTGNARRWNIIGSSGHLQAETDNTYDIGASGASRPRNVFIGGYIQASGLPTSDPAVAGRLWNDAGTVKISAG